MAQTEQNEGGLRGTWAALVEAFKAFNEDNVPQLAAALAYSALFAIAPFAIIATAVAGIFFGRSAAEAALMKDIALRIGPQAGAFVRALVVAASRPSSSIPAAVFGVLAALVTAMGLFGLLQWTLNQIWGVKPKPDVGWQRIILGRLPSFLMVLALGVLLLLTLAASTVISTLQRLATPVAGQAPGLALQLANFAASVVITAVAFALIYEVLPDVDLSLGDVFTGALITAILFNIGQVLIGLYIAYGSVASIYGAAGSLVVILVWVYFSAQVFLYGAELTQVYTKRRGSRPEPSKHAQRVRHLVPVPISLDRVRRLGRRSKGKEE